MKKIFTGLLMFLLTVQFAFADSIYRNEVKIQEYKEYIDARAQDIISQKSLTEKIDLLEKIQQLLTVYEKKSITENKANFINLLYALEEYIEESVYMGIEISTDIIITVIDDKRCSDCYTDSMVNELQTFDFLDNAQYIYKDFGDDGMKEYLIENDINYLPAFIFNTNSISDNNQITPYLQLLENGQYTMSIGSSFDPFIKRSDRGFLLLDKYTLDDIKSYAFIDGKSDAEITWIEYSDVECPFCAKLHNDRTILQAQEEFGDNLNIMFQHFPLDFHVYARDAAHALECIGDAYNTEKFYEMINLSYSEMGNNNFSLETFYKLANDIDIDTDIISTCAETDEVFERVQYQIETGTQVFNIQGTPGNVLINNITGEYQIIPGAFPYESFHELIGNLLR